MPNTHINIHITGPTGTGKTMLATIIRQALVAAAQNSHPFAHYLKGKAISFTESSTIETLELLKLP